MAPSGTPVWSPPASRRSRGKIYVGAICAVSLSLVAAVAYLTAASTTAVVSILFTIAAVPMAVFLGQCLVHLVVLIALRPPDRLPAREIDGVIPAELGACVVYPMIIHDAPQIDILMSTIKANADELCGIGLAAHIALVDFADAATMTSSQDGPLRAQLESRISALTADTPVFALFRQRRLNRADDSWMGWERKRGKLMEFIELASGSDQTSFLVESASDRRAVALARSVEFVITLDAESRISRDAVLRLVGTAAHEHNRAVVDHASARITSGYTFLRPEFASGPPETAFEFLAFGPGGPGEGPAIGHMVAGHDLFHGQGLIDVAAARVALSGRIRDNTVLSHDTLEGALGGAARVFDTAIVDSNPGSYLAFRSRAHRWARGDVHSLPWVFGRCRRALNGVSRWLLLADAFEQVMALSAVAMLVLAWFGAPPGGVGLWTIAIVTAYVADELVIRPVIILFMRSPGPSVAGRIAAIAHGWAWSLVRKMLWLALLLDRALVAADALIRASWRMVTGKNVLQWQAASRAQMEAGRGWRPYWSAMWLTPTCAAVLGLILALTAAGSLAWAAPFLLVWFLSPQIASALDHRLKRDPA